jgi:hypothetical protein
MKKVDAIYDAFHTCPESERFDGSVYIGDGVCVLPNGQFVDEDGRPLGGYSEPKSKKLGKVKPLPIDEHGERFGLGIEFKRYSHKQRASIKKIVTDLRAKCNDI